MKQCKDQNNLNNLTLMNWYTIHKAHLNDLIHEFVLAQEPERSQRIFWILQLRRQKEESNRALHFWLQVKVSKFVLSGLSKPGGRRAITPNILEDQLTLLLYISSNRRGGGHYHLPSHHIFGPSYGSVPSFMYAAKNKNYFSEFWKERDRRPLFSPRLSHSVSHSHTCLLL